jgi:hypothetical protein
MSELVRTTPVIYVEGDARTPKGHEIAEITGEWFAHPSLGRRWQSPSAAFSAAAKCKRNRRQRRRDSGLRGSCGRCSGRACCRRTLGRLLDRGARRRTAFDRGSVEEQSVAPYPLLQDHVRSYMRQAPPP